MCALLVREDLSSLPFTTMCIREALRLHSPVQAVTRRYIQDVKLPGERTVPKGEKSLHNDSVTTGFFALNLVTKT